jgi:two-component sensor histidine kinase
LVVVVVMAGLAGLVQRLDRHHAEEVARMLREENHLKMLSTEEHITEYLQSVYSTLLFVSLDHDVLAMSRQSYGYLRRIIAHQQSLNLLSELYVVERTFDGTGPPFMVFAPTGEKSGPEDEEYQTLVAQLARFAADPGLEAQISEPVRMCLPDSNDENDRGLVVSVPIRREGELVGLVAGMVAQARIAEVLERGNYHNMVMLIGERSGLFGCSDLPDAVRGWIVSRLRDQGVLGFFGAAPTAFTVGPWLSLWEPLSLPDRQRWWLVFQYDEQALLGARSAAVWGGGRLAAGGLLVTGLAVALLILALRRRLADEQAHGAAQTQAAAALSASLHEREVLLKETNHRVKNNLQVVASLLELQARWIGDPQALAALHESVSRVRTMGSVHERLYRSRDLARIDIAEYVRGLVGEAFASYGLDPGAIRLHLRVDEIAMEADTAIPCGLIINELVSNALKHAFPGGRQGSLYVDLRRAEGSQIALTVRDDGIGLPPENDLARSQSLGLELVRALVRQLGGTLALGGGLGAEVTVLFPAQA